MTNEEVVWSYWVIQIYVKVGGVGKREKAEGGKYFETVTPQCRFETILLEDSYVAEGAFKKSF